MAMVGGLNAKRFAGKPLRQPTYSFRDIPRCAKDLTGSSLYEINNRDELNNAMAEMILLCNETMRRQHITEQQQQKTNGGTKRTAKPLSLEYIADRLDVDDPMFGYVIRTETQPKNDAREKWKKGMLQGFVTVTTFTNWQRTFRWDSMHDSAFAYDDETLAEAMVSGVRSYDRDGSLAEALQATVRCGDPWNEGIVWPRIAEISLLGAMGCGKNLVSLVIEKLECMKPEAKRNYDYVALQATNNSIPFYESLGFVRVGGITEDDKFEEKQAKLKNGGSDCKDSLTRQDSDDSSSDGSSIPQSEIVSSAVELYVTKVPGETPSDVAKKLKVDVWDIIFLNHYVYPEIGTRSRLMKDTQLYVPAKHVQVAEATSNATRVQNLGGTESTAPNWYIADENDTPRMIAKKFDVSCHELVDANRERLPELNWNSKLKEGTRIKVSHFHIHDDKHVPYCHWTFPDDTFETSEPSYMMVRKLNRRTGAKAKVKPVESSLAVPISPFTAPPSDLFSQVQRDSPAPTDATNGKTSSSKKRGAHASEPKKPKRPLSGYMLYCSDQREAMKEEFDGMKGPDVMKILSKMWRELPEGDKASYVARQAKEQSRYKQAMEKYEKALELFYDDNPDLKVSAEGNDTSKSQTLFNKVVKLNTEGVAQTGSEYEYYFVLTFIPDLCWAHLAPLRRVGTWGPDKPKAEGRPIWMLVDESEGKEVDISGSFCVPVRSRAMRRTADADCEQWDIIDTDEAESSSFKGATDGAKDGRCSTSGATTNSRSRSLTSRSGTTPLSGTIERQSVPQQSTGKKRMGLPRKHPLPDAVSETPAGTKQGRPPRRQYSTTKPPTESLEPKKTGRPSKHPLSEPSASKKQVTRRGGRRPQQPTPSASSKRRIESDSEDEEYDPEIDKSVPKRRGRSSNMSRSATKPLDGKVERKKRKRGPAKQPAKRSMSGEEDEAEAGSLPPSERRLRPRRQTLRSAVDDRQASVLSDDDDDARPTKRRKLPRRGAKPALGSLQDADSDEDGGMTPLTCTYSRRKSTSSRSPRNRDGRGGGGSSPFRTVALTRSAKKLSASSLMFRPKRVRVQG